MSKCIECNPRGIHLLPQKHGGQYRHCDTTTITTFSGLFSTNSIGIGNLIELRTRRRRHGYGNGISVIISSQLLQPSAFPASSSLSFSLATAVPKPAHPTVLLQTSALLIFVYLIANFVVPQLLSKSLGLHKADENEKPSTSSSTASHNLEKPNSTSNKQGFNSTRPR